MLTRETIRNETRLLLRTYAANPDSLISDDTRLDTFCTNSLAGVEAVMGLEEQFGIRPNNPFPVPKTFGELVEYLVVHTQD